MLKVDLSRFRHFASEVAKARGKTEAEVVHEGLRAAIIGSRDGKGLIHIVPKRSPAVIRADLKAAKIGIKLVMRKLKREGYFKTRRTRTEIQARIKSDVDAFTKKAVRGAGVMKVAFLAAANALGDGKLRQSGGGGTLYPSGEAARGSAQKARPGVNRAVAQSAVDDSARVLAPYMQQAVDNAVDNLKGYFLRKLGKLYADASRL